MVGHSRGFALTLIVAVIAILAVGVGGYFVFKSRQTPSQSVSSTSTAGIVQQSSTTTDETGAISLPPSPAITDTSCLDKAVSQAESIQQMSIKAYQASSTLLAKVESPSYKDGLITSLKVFCYARMAYSSKNIGFCSNLAGMTIQTSEVPGRSEISAEDLCVKVVSGAQASLLGNEPLDFVQWAHTNCKYIVDPYMRSACTQAVSKN